MQVSKMSTGKKNLKLPYFSYYSVWIFSSCIDLQYNSMQHDFLFLNKISLSSLLYLSLIFYESRLIKISVKIQIEKNDGNNMYLCYYIRLHAYVNNHWYVYLYQGKK